MDGVWERRRRPHGISLTRAVHILMPSIVDPYRDFSGAATVTRHLITVLQSAPSDATVECVAVPRSVGLAHRARQAAAIARSMVSRLPAKVAYSFSRAFASRVAALAREERFDLVMINGSDLLWLEPLLPADVPRLVVEHNVEHQLFESQVARLALPVVRGLIRRECRRLERHEVDGLRRVGNVIFLSSVDAERAVAAAGVGSCLVVPPMFGDTVVRHDRPERTGDQLDLGFIGNLHWWPNRQGLTWLLREVLPALRRPTHLHVFGEGRAPIAAGRTRVSLHGAVDDVEQVWERCDLMLCPMRAGGGVSVKLAESVFYGRPTLATPLAAQGLPLGADELVAVREPEDWRAYLDSVDLSVLRRGRMATAMSEPFTYRAHRDRLDAFVRQLAGGIAHW